MSEPFSNSKSLSPNAVKPGRKWAESLDFVLPLGNACRPARQLAVAGLRTFSAPLDWMMRYSLDLAADLIIRGFKGFFASPEEDAERGKGKSSRYVVDRETGMVSMHGFSWRQSVEEGYPEFCDKMSRRGGRLLANILAAKRIGVLMNRQEPEEAILAFARKISTAFPNQYFYVLNLRDDKMLPRGQRFRKTLEENNGYSVCEITLNDSHKDGDSPQLNPKNFWLGDVDAWQKIISEEFSLSDKSMNPIESKIKVSVIIPCYNVEKYLRECLDSVVNQTLRDIEIICVDDGSTDSTLQILEEYAAKDSRIKILRQQNQFAGVARNNGMKIARGKYLCFLDSDDFFDLTMFKKMVKRAEEAEADVVVCDFNNFFELTPERNWIWKVGKPKNFLRKEPFFSAESALLDMPVERFSFTPWNKLFNSKFIKKIENKFSGTRSSNDLAFVSFALYSARRIAILPKSLLSYRRAIKGTISSTRGKFLETNLVAWKDLKMRMLSAGIYEKFKNSFLMALVGSVSYELRQNPSIRFLCSVYNEFPNVPYESRIAIERVFGDNERKSLPGNANENDCAADENADSQVKVSVIIPVYNAEKYLRRCIDSVRNQTLKDIEIICVNDGSADSSLQILNEYASKDSRVRVISQQNRGQAFARNAGMGIAQGRYIGFVDSDDYIEKEMYERLFLEAQKNNADVVECSAVVEDAGGLDVRSVQSQQRSFNFNEWQMDFPVRTLFTEQRFHAVLWNKIYSRQFLKSLDLSFDPHLRKGEDAIFQWKVMPFVRRYKRIGNRFYHYCFGREGSVETSKNPENTWSEFIEGSRNLRAFWAERGLFDQMGNILVWRLWNIAKWRLSYCFGGNVSGEIFKRKMLDIVSLFPELKDENALRVLGGLLSTADKGLLSHFATKRLPEIIVSLTSFPARIGLVHLTVESLLSQTWKADRIVLWLADSQFPLKEEELPEALLALRERGLEIRWCEDLRSYKKLVPALKAFPEDVIVTVDDDLILEPTWLEGLVSSYLKNPTFIHTHRAHEIAFSDSGNLAPYALWRKEIKTDKASFNNFLTGVGGCLYPPTCLHKDVFNVKKFQKLCPHGDDIWFWAMAVLAGTKICVTLSVFCLNHPAGSQEVGLWKTVNSLGENDRALQRVLAAYPEILPKLERVPVGGFASSPKISNSAKSANPRPSGGVPAKSSQKPLPRFLVRLGALFILDKQARKRWRERHMDLTPRDGIDINAHTDLRRDSALKRFAVRVAALFIFSKSKRKAFRAKYMDLNPRDGVDVHALSPEERRLRKQKKRERNPLRRLFNALVPASRSKVTHTEKRIIRHMEWQTQQVLSALKRSAAENERSRERQTCRILEEIKASQAQSERRFDELKRELAQVRERSEAMAKAQAASTEAQTDRLSRELALLKESLVAEIDSAKQSSEEAKSRVDAVLKRLESLKIAMIEAYARIGKKYPASLEFRTFGDLAHCIRTNLHKVPADTDLVVGLPRSGMIPAYMIALFMNKKCCSLDEFLSGMSISHGHRPVADSALRKILVVDDSCFNGRAMDVARERLKGFSGAYEFVYTAVYGRTESLKKIDFCLEVVDGRRVWQWNYLNHVMAESACFDMDGVLCVDPTPEENDDGPKYSDFIKNAKPLYIPNYKIRTIVTSRLEKYRSATEAWLREHGVCYDELVMLDLPTAEERRRQGCHAEFKAEAYKARPETTLFVESEERQAKQIALLSGKEVLCVSTDELY